MSWASDLRYVLRALRKSPTFMLAAVATLSLGIGATTAIFSAVNGILLRQLPFPAASRLVLVCERHPSVAAFCVGSPPNAADWAARSKTLEAVGIARDWPFSAKNEQGSEALNGGLATAGFFRVLGIVPALGRVFVPEDIGGHVVILSHELWQSRFGGNHDIVGQSITLDNEPYTVVGVLAPGVTVPGVESAQLWVPLPFDQHLEENRKWRGFGVYGRLAFGVTIRQAQDEMTRIAASLAEEHPETNAGWTVEVTDLRSHVVGSVQRALLVLLGAVGFVLLIACANVANLMLARITHRGRELAVRAALGAGRWAAARLILFESLVLATVAGVLGVMLSFWGLDAFHRLAPASIPRVAEVNVDLRVLGFVVGVSLMTSALFGAGAFAQVGRLHLGDMLHGREVVPSTRVGLRGALVVTETALALVLLTGAGLFLKSFTRLAHWNPGFDLEHLTVTWLLAPDAKYRTGAQVNDLFQRVVADMNALPGVVSAGATSAGPLLGGIETGEFRIVGRTTSTDRPPTTRYNDIDPTYFATLGLPMVRGRTFTASDAAGAPGVAIINQALARRYWPGLDPLGQQIVMHDRTMTVVGVVSDIPPIRPDRPVEPEMYWPKAQEPRWATYLLLRTASDPGPVVAAAKRRLQELEPDLSVSTFQTFDARLGIVLVYPRFVTLLMGVFSTIALVLAAVGVYGVIAYGVARRTREIGIQMALGAKRYDILRKVIGQGLMLTSIGIGIGVVGALAITPVLRSLLAGVEPSDPLTLAAVSVALALVAVLASYIPAWRASGIDAMEALRSE